VARGVDPFRALATFFFVDAERFYLLQTVLLIGVPLFRKHFLFVLLI